MLSAYHVLTAKRCFVCTISFNSLNTLYLEAKIWDAFFFTKEFIASWSSVFLQGRTDIIPIFQKSIKLHKVPKLPYISKFQWRRVHAPLRGGGDVILKDLHQIIFVHYNILICWLGNTNNKEMLRDGFISQD